MYKLGFMVVVIVAACGESTHVSTSSVPPSGNGADGAAAPPADAGSISVDAGTVDAGVASGSDAGASPMDAGGSDGAAATCSLSGPTKLASAHAVIKLLVDGEQLYFLDVASVFAGLYRMPKAGGTPTDLAGVRSLSDDGAAWDFALADKTIYLISARLDDGFGLTSNRVTVIDKASRAIRFVAANAYGCPTPTFMRVTASGDTAWLAQNNHVPGFGLSTCTQAPFDTIEVLPAGAAQSRTIVTQRQTRTGFAPPGISAIVVDSTHLFWSGAQGTFRAHLDGSAIELLASVTAGQLVSDGQTLFAVMGTSVVAITAPQQLTTIYDGTSPGDTTFAAFASLIAVDDARVWVATPTGVVAVGKDGTAPRTVVPTTDAVRTVAVDAAQVYYSTGSSLLTACK